MNKDIKYKARLITTKRIKSDLGSVRKFISKNSVDLTIEDTSEVYFSSINPNCIKGWKKHTKMICKLAVISGKIRFYIQDNDQDTLKFLISEQDDQVLEIKPGTWFAFENVSKQVSIICNAASMVHDPNEVMTKQF